MRIDPLPTAKPTTGPVRYMTNDFLRDAYLTPKFDDVDLVAIPEGRKAPWIASFPGYRRRSSPETSSQKKATKFVDLSLGVAVERQ